MPQVCIRSTFQVPQRFWVHLKKCKSMATLFSLAFEEKAKRLMLKNGMKAYQNNFCKKNFKNGSDVSGETKIDLIQTVITCPDIEKNIQTYIQAFFDQHQYKCNFPDLAIIAQFDYESHVMLEPTEYINLQKWKRKYSMKFLLNIDFTADYVKEYNHTINKMAKLLTGERNKEVAELLIYGYLRENDIPTVIMGICSKYYGKIDQKNDICVRKFDPIWNPSKNIGKIVTELRTLFDKVIEGERKNKGWKCILSRGIIQDDTAYNAYDDNWLLWWFLRDNKTENTSRCIVLQFTSKWSDFH